MSRFVPRPPRRSEKPPTGRWCSPAGAGLFESRAGIRLQRLLAAFLGLVLPLLAADEPQPPPPAGPPTVFHLPRLAAQDLVVLRSGARLTGTVAIASVRLNTADGPLVLPTHAVAGLDFTDREQGLTILVTRQPDRFTGFLEDRALAFTGLSDPTPRQLHRESIRQVVFGRHSPPASPTNAGVLVELRNGDFFAAEWLNPRIVGADDRQPLASPPGGHLALAFGRPGDEVVEAVLDQGRTVPVRIPEDLEFRLASGTDWRVHRDRVARLIPAGPLPAAWLARIGVPPVDGKPAGSRDDSRPAFSPPGDLVWIPPGEFTMGSPPGERERDLDEGPLTRVILPAGFWLGRHEITQAEYESVMGVNPSRHAGNATWPVEKLTWSEAMDYCERLTRRDQEAGRIPQDHAYRLPTEAEWEYACRAGTTTRFSHGDDPGGAALTGHAWFGDNADSAPHPVGTRKPNPWGLYDLHGNVLEWCLDSWQGSLPGGTVTNLPAAPQGNLRLARGGSWLYPARAARSANRDSYGLLNRCSDLGFRVVLSSDPVAPALTPDH